MPEYQFNLYQRLADYYNSEFVRKNMPWILETPFEVWIRKEMLRRGVML